MARHDAIEGPAQRRRVKRPAHAPAKRQMVGLAGALHLRQEPQALLGERRQLPRGLRYAGDREPLRGPRRDDICYATTNRQQAVVSVARESELVIVLGSHNSSNSQRLAEVARAEGTPAYLVDDLGEIDLGWLQGVTRVGITAGASAPPYLVDQVVAGLGALGPVSVRESQGVEETVHFTLPREVS